MTARRRKRWAILVGLLAVVVIVIVVLLSRPQWGGTMTAARLTRAQANPQYRDGAFTNLLPDPERTAGDAWTLLKGQFSGDQVRVPPGEIPVVKVDPRSLALMSTPGLRAFWIGHSSTFIEIDGLRVLLDPIFSEYASPFDIGPKRFHPPPIALADLPKIHAVLISHDHYDHLDMRTLQQLAPQGTMFFVPLGVGAHLDRWGVPATQIRELEWWQEESVGGVRIVCTPSRHYSGRRLTGRNATLWSSWSVIGPQHRFYYSGDTGYSNHFAAIGERFGPFDMSFIKVGAYGPTAGWIEIHMSAEDAVRAHRDLRARRMFPLHWGTFNMAFHDWDEPIERALEAAARENVDLVTPRVGEIVVADQPFVAQRWWKEVH